MSARRKAPAAPAPRPFTLRHSSMVYVLRLRVQQLEPPVLQLRVLRSFGYGVAERQSYGLYAYGLLYAYGPLPLQPGARLVAAEDGRVVTLARESRSPRVHLYVDGVEVATGRQHWTSYAVLKQLLNE